MRREIDAKFCELKQFLVNLKLFSFKRSTLKIKIKINIETGINRLARATCMPVYEMLLL